MGRNGLKDVIVIALGVVVGALACTGAAFWLTGKYGKDSSEDLPPDTGSEIVSGSELPSESDTELPDNSSVELPDSTGSELPGDSSDGENQDSSDEGEHTAHEWVELRKQEATCNAEGMLFYECGCGALMARTIPMAEHVEIVLEYTAPTCETSGSKTYKCANCDLSETVTLPAVGHNYEYGVCKNTNCYSPDVEWLADDENYYLAKPEAGENMYGKWYRVYENGAEHSKKLTFTSNGNNFAFSYNNIQCSPDGYIGSYSEFKGIITNKTAEYLDICIVNSSNRTSPIDGITIYTIDETATIETINVEGDVVRLEPIEKSEVSVGDAVVGNTYRLYKGSSAFSVKSLDGATGCSISYGGIDSLTLAEVAEFGAITIEYETEDYVDITINGGEMIAYAPNVSGEPSAYTLTISEDAVVSMRYNVVQISKVGE